MSKKLDTKIHRTWTRAAQPNGSSSRFGFLSQVPKGKACTESPSVRRPKHRQRSWIFRGVQHVDGLDTWRQVYNLRQPSMRFGGWEAWQLVVASTARRVKRRRERHTQAARDRQRNK